jgi:hypothetical protein
MAGWHQIESTREATIDNVGGLLARYDLVVVIAWFGVLKFTGVRGQGQLSAGV